MPLSRTRSLLANINGSSSSTGATPPAGHAGHAHAHQHALNNNHLNSLGEFLYLSPQLSASQSVYAGYNGKGGGGGGEAGQQQLPPLKTAENENNANKKDLMASSALIANMTNGANAGAGGVTANAAGGGGSNAAALHLNGMQTLPHVRPSGANGATELHHVHHLTQNGNATDSPKHAPNNVSSGVNSSASNVSSSATPSSTTSNNVKPKTMVATPEQVMKLYMNKLTPYEHHEIFNYPQIYFIGANAKKRPGIIGAPNNCGYDDDQGSYTHIPHDHLAYRYEVLKVIGKGSFGQVVKAYDHKEHQHVALKMVRNEKRFHRQAQEEIRILEHLRKQDKDNTFNIIHLYDHFTFRSHTCITFELLSINLYELIKKNKFQGFSLQLVRKFAHSLLQCLDLLYRNKIIHCDMKPENVLLKQQGRSGIKVGQFVIKN